jgi:hypothetical protein
MTDKCFLRGKNPLHFVLFALLVSTAVLQAQSNLVLFVSSPGDYIGGGQTYVTDNPDEFIVSGSTSPIMVEAFGFYYRFGGPDGSSLSVGSYVNATRLPFNGSSPGLSVFGNGRSCDFECGSFQISELEVNGSGEMTRLWMTFSNYCECSTAPMSGEIRYNSTLAPPTLILTQQPTNQLVCCGDTAKFEIGVIGSAPLGYQWRFNGNPIPDATNATLTLTNAQVPNAGLYSVTVTNDSGGMVSSNASLTLFDVFAWGAGRSNTFLPQVGQSRVPVTI